MSMTIRPLPYFPTLGSRPRADKVGSTLGAKPTGAPATLKSNLSSPSLTN